MSRIEGPEAATNRLRRLEALYHELLARPTHERVEALAAACPDDPSLAAEVQSLLNQPDSGAGPLGTPALEAAARVYSGASSSLAGKRLGVFEFQELLGVGGMGEVYRARDTKLGRDVAIKVLPSAFASDPDRLTRFNREARVLASLNHPNIGTLYGLQEDGGAIALVLEFVEGETLGRRIAGKGLPVPEALSMARQVADALDAAHERGVVHRDLKPANIMITASGAVKVLDFGLARLGQRETAAPDLSGSPTATSGGTREGAILGTTAYMSPEQARGQPVDRRTDIWAFGCVLFEMLTGRPAFARDTTSDTIAAIIEREADWALLPKGTPANVARLLRRCLEKDPKRRLRDIGDARAELEDVRFGVAEAEPSAREQPRRAVLLGWALTLAALGVVAFLALRPRPAPPESRLAMPLGPGLQFPGVTAYLAVAPDGRTIAFTAQKGVGVAQQSTGGGEIYLRSLDRMVATPLAEEGSVQFFSPDGRWIGFFEGGRLMKISVDGGAAVDIADGANGQGDWGQGNTIVFSDGGDRPSHGIRRVSSGGGRVEAITTLDRAAGHTNHLSPQILPGGRSVLYTIRSGRKFQLAVAPLSGGPPRIIAEDAAFGRYAGGGVLVFQRGTSLFAARFDEKRHTLGERKPVLDGVIDFPIAPAWSLSGGTLVYRPQGDDTRLFYWVDRRGVAQAIDAPARSYWNPQISPRGDRIAIHLFEGGGSDAWTFELAPKRLQRITADGISRSPAWSPDGTRLLIHRRAALADIVSVPIDGSGAVEPLTHSGQAAGAAFMTDDGKTLVYHEIGAQTGYDLMVTDIGTRSLPRAIVQTAKLEAGARLHPSGRFMAYATNVTGRDDVFVTPFPRGGSRVPVTIDGGREPRWSRDGRELFYRKENQMYSVALRPGGGLVFDPPRLLFDVPYFRGGGPGNTQYDVASDGRFLMMKTPERETPYLSVILNWRAALQEAIGES